MKLAPLICCALWLAARPAAAEGFAGFQDSSNFDERVASFALEPGVRVEINAPAASAFGRGKKIMLIFYALPNGNTIEQTIGRALKPGDDWHFNIQHIGAQTRFLRALLPDRNVVVVYLEARAKSIARSWPTWRKENGDKAIPGFIDSVKKIFPRDPVETVLSGHSGGGSFIFGYLNAVEKIPDDVTRIAFLDSDYAYDPALGHAAKLCQWLDASPDHRLCVLAYNDAAGLLNGKPFVSAAGGTWGRTHAMLKDFSAHYSFTRRQRGEIEVVTALNGRITLLLKDNPERKIYHTVQVERNGFIEAMVSGTADEGRGYDYFGPRAYEKWIAGK